MILVKGKSLVEMLGKAEDTTSVQAAMAGFGSAANDALSRRVTVLREGVLAIWNDKKIPAKTQTQATNAFKGRLTKNTLTE